MENISCLACKCLCTLHASDSHCYNHILSRNQENLSKKYYCQQLPHQHSHIHTMPAVLQLLLHVLWQIRILFSFFFCPLHVPIQNNTHTLSYHFSNTFLLQLLRSFTSPFAQEILEILINKNTKGYDLRGIKYNRN